MTPIIIQGSGGLSTNWGHIFGEVFACVLALGYDAFFRPFETMKGQEIPPVFNRRSVTSQIPIDRELIIGPPTQMPTGKRKTVFYTRHTKADARMAREMLNRAQGILTPSQWDKERFIELGVTQPIEVVKLGYNPEVLEAKPVNLNGPCVFGVSANGVSSKVIHHMKNVFVNTNDVEIRMAEPQKQWFQREAWFHGLTAYISANNDGFGLSGIQSMACGRHVVAMPVRTRTAYYDSIYAVPISDDHSGFHPVALTDCLRRIYLGRREVENTPLPRIQTWEETTKQIMEHVEKWTN